MSGNGARIGMVTTRKARRRIQQVLPVAPTACAVVAVGAMLPWAAACRAVTTTRPSTRATTLASVLLSPSLELQNEWMLTNKEQVVNRLSS